MPVSCLGCNLIKMCEECNLRPSDLFYSLAANMAGTECDPAISTRTQSLGAGAKPWPLIGQMSLKLASDWLLQGSMEVNPGPRAASGYRARLGDRVGLMCFN